VKIKNVLLASVASAAALIAVPALAASGQVDAAYQRVDGNGSGNDLNNVVFGGAVATQLTGDWGAQFDAHFDRIDGSGYTTTLSTGAAHLFDRNASYLAGGYASVANVEGLGLYAFGLEGQKYFDRATLYGTVGYGTSDMHGSNFGAWNIAGDAKGFVNDNLALDVKVDYTAGAHNLDGHVTTYGVGGEWKPQNSAVSLFANYARHEAHGEMLGFSGAGGYNTYNLGVRWNFGVKTLKERDRSGASLNTGSFLSSSLLGF
jgi:hypothetical protein